MPGRDETAWPGGKPPHTDALFVQIGEDARKATAKCGEKGVAHVVDSLARTIDEFRKQDAR